MEIHPPCSSKPVMLLVLGPHRSGTSLTARMLECLGAANSSNLMSPDRCNPTGYFEDNDVYTFNDRHLLPALHRSWYSVSPTNWRVLSCATRSRLESQALAIVRRNYSLTRPLSVLKEPRISMLLPFWVKVLQKAGFSVCAVCTVRSPASVIRSLHRRDNLSISKTHGGLLYLGTWHSVLAGVSCLPTAFAFFQQILSNPAATLRSISTVLQLEVPPDFGLRVAAFASTELNHNLSHKLDEEKNPDYEHGLSGALYALFNALRLLPLHSSLRDVEQVRKSAQQIVRPFLPLLHDYDNLHEALNTEKKQHAAVREEAFNAKQHAEAYAARIQSLGIELSAAEDIVKKSETLNTTLQHKVHKLEQRIAHLRCSSSWKITKPMRWIGQHLRTIHSQVKRTLIAIFLSKRPADRNNHTHA